MPEPTDNAIANDRVPVTRATHEELKEFRNGLNATFDEAIQFLVHLAKGNEDTYLAGKKLREQFKEFKNSQNG